MSQRDVPESAPPDPATSMESHHQNGSAVTSDGVPQRTGNNLDPWYANYAERSRRARRLRGPRPVRRRLPPRGGLARRRHAVRLRPPAGADRLVDGARHARAGRRRAAVRLRSGHSRAARADPRGHGARGHPRHASTTSSSTTGSQHALDLVAKLFIDPGDVDPRRGARATSARSACSGRSRRASCTSPWTRTG